MRNYLEEKFNEIIDDEVDQDVSEEAQTNHLFRDKRSLHFDPLNPINSFLEFENPDLQTISRAKRRAQNELDEYKHKYSRCRKAANDEHQCDELYGKVVTLSHNIALQFEKMNEMIREINKKKQLNDEIVGGSEEKNKKEKDKKSKKEKEKKEKKDKKKDKKSQENSSEEIFYDKKHKTSVGTTMSSVPTKVPVPQVLISSISITSTPQTSQTAHIPKSTTETSTTSELPQDSSTTEVLESTTVEEEPTTLFPALFEEIITSKPAAAKSQAIMDDFIPDHFETTIFPDHELSLNKEYFSQDKMAPRIDEHMEDQFGDQEEYRKRYHVDNIDDQFLERRKAKSNLIASTADEIKPSEQKDTFGL